MNLTVSALARSLADYLAPVLPGVAMYEDPNQQGSQPPCMFLQTRHNRLKLEMDGYWLRTLGLDLTYLLDYNLPDLQQRYQAAAEALDLVMETFPYSDGSSTGQALLRTYDRSWKVDLDAMHYKFELRERVTLPKPDVPKMQELELHQYMKEADHGR